MSWETTGLEHYSHYWGTALGHSHSKAKRKMRALRDDVSGVWGSADDPLGSHTPMAQDAILGRIARLAAGRIDDWESLVYPKLSPGENYQIILENGGELPAEERRAVEKAIAETIDDQERSRAVDLLYENVEAIDNGEKEQLVDDIAAEYGEEFVEETLRSARVDTTPAETDEPIVSANESESTAIDVETPEPAESEPEPVEAADITPEPVEFERSVPVDDVEAKPEPARSTSAETKSAGTSAKTEKPDYSGILGTFRLFADYYKALFQAGYRDAVESNSSEKQQQATLDSY